MVDLLRMEQIGKAFPGIKALDQVDFDLRPGEIHGLVGENGAGKSTLMKILAGIYTPDSGRILLRGETVSINDPRRAQQYGISIVHQESLLFTNLTIAENVLVGQEPTRIRPFHLLNRPQLFQNARKYLAYFDSALSPRTPVYQLSVAQQQIVEICKALALQADILVLDEPTSSLSEGEAEQLFAIVNQLRTQGIAIIYISHRLKEIIRLANRVTVLRDGKRVGTLDGDAIDMTRIINMMVGRELSDVYGTHEHMNVAEPVLEVTGLSGTRFSNINLSVRRGEIVGLTGLIGSGRSEIGLTLFGHLPARRGQMWLSGAEYRPTSSEDAMHSGVAFVPEDRRKLGLFTSMSVRRNLTVTRLKDLQRRGMINSRAEQTMAHEVAERLRIRTPHLEERVLNLSGGNQQKTMLGKWLARSPKLLIVDEPTRGVDVGAKVEIYATLRQLAAEGIGIIMISSEMPEVNGMCDRVYVMHEGTLHGELGRDQINEQNIMTLASGHALAGST